MLALWMRKLALTISHEAPAARRAGGGARAGRGGRHALRADRGRHRPPRGGARQHGSTASATISCTSGRSRRAWTPASRCWRSRRLKRSTAARSTPGSRRKLEAPPEGLRRALRRRSFDGDPVDRLRRAGWQLVGWRDLRALWQRRAFDREPAIEALVARVHGLHARLATCSRTTDTLYADLWPLRRLREDVRTRGKAVDARQIGRELGVRYVLEASVDWEACI